MHIKEDIALRISHSAVTLFYAALAAEMTFTIICLNIISALSGTQIQREPYKKKIDSIFLVYIVMSPESSN